MARKSRTQPKQSPDTLNVLSKVYKTAIYVRLSAEKDETRDRKTLINQRNLIKNFVDQQMDMEIHDIYMDDEISGTTFDRPEFERMMSDMRAGRINCIVVKDLSRLGRDYIETGNLVERVFPMMNIRFVAITDNYDSSKKDADLMVAVTNIANDLYAKTRFPLAHSVPAGCSATGLLLQCGHTVALRCQIPTDGRQCSCRSAPYR